MTAAVEPLEPKESHDRARTRYAAIHARTVFPGPIGELLYRELLTWEDFGYRFGGNSLVERVVVDIEQRWKEYEHGSQ